MKIDDIKTGMIYYIRFKDDRYTYEGKAFCSIVQDGRIGFITNESDWGNLHPRKYVIVDPKYVSAHIPFIKMDYPIENFDHSWLKEAVCKQILHEQLDDIISINVWCNYTLNYRDCSKDPIEANIIINTPNMTYSFVCDGIKEALPLTVDLKDIRANIRHSPEQLQRGAGVVIEGFSIGKNYFRLYALTPPDTTY